MKENPEILNSQAIELASHGQYVEAIACFKRAITIARDNSLLWYNLGITYRDAGMMQLAKDALLTAHKINEEDQDIIETLAHTYYISGELEEALTLCAKGLELNIRNAHLWNNSGVIFFTQGDYDSACEAFEHAVTIDPNYYDAVFNLRDTYQELGNLSAAAECDTRLKNIKQGDFYA